MPLQVTANVYFVDYDRHFSQYEHALKVCPPIELVKWLQQLGYQALDYHPYESDTKIAIQWIHQYNKSFVYSHVAYGQHHPVGGIMLREGKRIDTIFDSWHDFDLVCAAIEALSAVVPSEYNWIRGIRSRMVKSFMEASEQAVLREGGQQLIETLSTVILSPTQYAIYRIYDVSTATTGYIGVTNAPAERQRQHLRDRASAELLHAELGNDTAITSYKGLWLAYTLATSKTLRFEVLAVCDSKADAELLERQLIHEYLAAGEPLTNSQLYGAVRTTPCPYEFERLQWRQRLLGY